MVSNSIKMLFIEITCIIRYNYTNVINNNFSNDHSSVIQHCCYQYINYISIIIIYTQHKKYNINDTNNIYVFLYINSEK